MTRRGAPAWAPPHTKPWNDQKWKRDLLQLDALILQMKGGRLETLYKLREPKMKLKKNADAREAYYKALDWYTDEIQMLEAERRGSVIEV